MIEVFECYVVVVKGGEYDFVVFCCGFVVVC